MTNHKRLFLNDESSTNFCVRAWIIQGFYKAYTLVQRYIKYEGELEGIIEYR